MTSLSPVLDILAAAGTVVAKPLRNLLDEVAQVVDDHTVHENIADWPFAHFWFNPDEPSHSKLLHYFISSTDRHGCGAFLLQELLTAILPGENLEAEHCRTQAEKRDFNGQPDIQIIRHCGDGKDFAVIIENKVNGAKHQKLQLRRYVEQVEQRTQIRFDRIYAVHLRLRDDLNRDSTDRLMVDEDRRAVADHPDEAKRAHWISVTFDVHICQKWLKAVREKWPDDLDRRILAHLDYYGSLVRYLINLRKAHIMSDEILEVLKRAAGDANGGNKKLLTWADVQRLEESLGSMKPYVKRMLRGTLLIKIRDVLGEGVKTKWRLTSGIVDNDDPFSPQSEFDERFDNVADLCIPVTDVVWVCIGADTDWEDMKPFWIRYLKVGDEMSVDVERRIKDLANAWFKTAPEHYDWFSDEVYYKQKQLDEITYVNCDEEGIARELSGELLRMRDHLAEGLCSPRLGQSLV